MTRSPLARLVAASFGLAAVAAAQPQLLVPPDTPRPASTSMQTGGEANAAWQAALAFRQTKVEGRTLAKAVRKINRELYWFDNVDFAKTAAKQSHRPIVWFQVLGDRKGFT